MDFLGEEKEGGRGRLGCRRQTDITNIPHKYGDSISLNCLELRWFHDFVAFRTKLLLPLCRH